MARSLYICYFGVNEPLVNTQVIPYLRELTKGGHEITLLTFEPGGVDEADVRSRLAEQGIEWQWLRYHKRPSVPATLFDIANGVRFVRKLSRKKKFDIFHVRGHIPAPIGAMAKKMLGGKLLFDIRGFLPEEYVDAGVWDENGIVYKTFKRVEKWVMSEADGFVVLTEAAREILFPESKMSGFDMLGRPVEIIPCCVDMTRAEYDVALRNEERRKRGWTDRFVLTHVGSLGGLYLTDEIVALMAAAKRLNPLTFSLFLTQRPAIGLENKLRKAGFDSESFLIDKASPDEIVGRLMAADAAVSIVKQSYSSKSRSPTKIAEYLAAGLPVISNRGTGDVEKLIQNNNVGSLINEFTDSGFDKAVLEVLSSTNSAQHCRAVAITEFDLETVGGPRYRRLYERMLSKK